MANYTKENVEKAKPYVEEAMKLGKDIQRLAARQCECDATVARIYGREQSAIHYDYLAEEYRKMAANQPTDVKSCPCEDCVKDREEEAP